MGFSKMLELLQEKYKGYIVIASSGTFYLARGKDAILINSLLGLKLSCMEQEVCKIGFPISSLEKYTNLIKEKNYSYIVYYYDKQRNELEIKDKWKGKYKSDLEENKNNCFLCKTTLQGYKPQDKYLRSTHEIK